MPDNNTPKKDINSLIREVGDKIVKNKPAQYKAPGEFSDDELLSMLSDGPEKKKPLPKTGSETTKTPLLVDAEESQEPVTTGSLNTSSGDPSQIDFSKEPKIDNKFFSPESTQPAQVPLINNEAQEPDSNPFTNVAITEKDIKDKEEQAQQMDNGVNRPMSYLATFNQHVYGLPATVLETFSVGANQVGRLTEAIGLEDRTPTEEMPTYKLAQWYRDSIKELSPDNPAYQEELGTTVAGAIGDLATLVATGGTSRVPQAINEMQQFTKSSNLFSVAAKEGRKLISSPTALVGAMQVGVNEFKQAKAMGASDDEAMGAYVKNAAAGGILERIPIMKFWDRLDKTTGGGVKKAIINGTTQGVEEMTTEVAQQVFSNVDAANTYDAARKWHDGMTESGGIGFGLGFLLGAMGTSLRKKQSEAKTPEEKADIQKAIDYVEAKGTELKLQEESKDKKIQESNNPSETEGLSTEKNNGETEINTQGETTANTTEQQIPVSEEVVTPTEEIAPIKTEPEIPIEVSDQPSVETVKKPVVSVSENADLTKEDSDSGTGQPVGADRVPAVFNKKVSEITDALKNKKIDFSKVENSQEIQDEIEDIKLDANDLVSTIKSTKERLEKKKKLTKLQQKELDSANELFSKIPEDYEDYSIDTLEFISKHGEALSEYDGYSKVAERLSKVYDDIQANEFAMVSSEGTGDLFDPGKEQPSEVKTPTNETIEGPTGSNGGIGDTEVLLDGSDQQKERRFTNQVLKSDDVSEDVKSNITEEAKKYTPITNADTNSVANQIIKDKELPGALNMLMDKNSLISPAVRVALGNNIIKQANKAAKEAKSEIEKNQHLDSAIAAAEFMGPYMTEIGQGVQAASMFAKLSPEGALRAIEREVSKQRSKKLEEVEPTIDKIKEIVSGLTEEGIQKILELPKVRDLIIDKSGKVEGSAKKKAVKKAIDFLEGLKVDTKGKAFDVVQGLPISIWNGAISTIQTSLQAGLTITEAINKAVKYVKDKHKGDWDEKEFRGKFDTDLKKFEVGIDPEKAVKRGLKDLEIDIKKIIKEHYTKVGDAKKSLVDKLVSDAGLDEADAKEVAKNIEQEFDKLTSKAKKAALDKALSAKDRVLNKKKSDQLHEEIIKESNLGAITDERYREIYAEKMDLPQLTKEQAQKLMDLSEKVQTSKEGFQQRRAIEELLKYQDSIKGINWMDIGTSIWYTNVLSGFSTQEINFFANMAETFSEMYVAAVYNPKNIPFLMQGLYNGWGRGLLESWDTLKTGYAPIKSQKVDAPNILERVKLKGGEWNPFNYYKYIKRIMDASDIFAYHGLREMRAYELAASQARKDGKDKPTQEIWGKVYEKLYNTSDRRKEAEIQAKEEGLKGNDYNRRVSEIMDQSRPVEMMEDAGTAAARGTFNYDPEGTIGFLAEQIAAVVEKAQIKGFKPLKFVIPFTRIISNVANRYLDYSFVGFYRAYKGGIGTFVPEDSKYERKFTAEERAKEYIKATTGTLAMLTLFALSDPGDDDDPTFEITSEGTGDFRDNYELAQNGWQKYSIRIGEKWYSYQNTPLAIPLSIIGHMRDDEKYKGKSLDNKDAITKFSLAVHNNFQFITDMTFLKGLGDFMGSFSNENPNAAVSYFEKLSKTTVKGFVVPNLYTQSAKEIQRYYGMPTKEANGLLQSIIRDVPVARDGLNDMIDALGDPIIADTDKLTSDVETDVVWDVIIKNNAWIGRINKNSTTVYDPKTKKERLMTDEEYYKFAKIRGQYIKSKIIKNLEEFNTLEKDEAKDLISEFKKKGTKRAKKELFAKK